MRAHKHFNTIAYLILALAIVVGLWAAHQNRSELNRHLNSHISQDQDELQRLEREICRRQNIVQARLHLKLTNCRGEVEK